MGQPWTGRENSIVHEHSPLAIAAHKQTHSLLLKSVSRMRRFYPLDTPQHGVLLESRSTLLEDLGRDFSDPDWTGPLRVQGKHSPEMRQVRETTT